MDIHAYALMHTSLVSQLVHRNIFVTYVDVQEKKLKKKIKTIILGRKWLTIPSTWVSKHKLIMQQCNGLALNKTASPKFDFSNNFSLFDSRDICIVTARFYVHRFMHLYRYMCECLLVLWLANICHSPKEWLHQEFSYGRPCAKFSPPTVHDVWPLHLVSFKIHRKHSQLVPGTCIC